jgi:hypothetical protein
MSESFINPGGSLSVQIPADEVNWFDFLWFSRRTKSPRGGWNNKSNWRAWGLDVLTACATTEVIAKWTAQSLSADDAYLPKPRSGDFMFGREHSVRRKMLEPAFMDYPSPLEQATENELSYAVFHGGFGRLQPLQGINLIGYEVPLAADSEGQLKVDLFGLSEAPGAIEIVELKNAKNHSDSPLIALTEAICYGLQALRCKKHLLECDKLSDKAYAFAHIRLTILAPASYWKYWCGGDNAEEAVKSCTVAFSEIIQGVNFGIPAMYEGARLSASAQALCP